jgi:hypothetical protein
VNEYLADHADFLEAQWEWCVELGMVDEETDSNMRGWGQRSGSLSCGLNRAGHSCRLDSPGVEWRD